METHDLWTNRIDETGHPLERGEAMALDLGTLEAELAGCEDEDEALAMLEQRERLKLVIEAERISRRARLERERAADAIANARESRAQSLSGWASRLEHELAHGLLDRPARDRLEAQLAEVRGKLAALETEGAQA